MYMPESHSEAYDMLVREFNMAVSVCDSERRKALDRLRDGVVLAGSTRIPAWLWNEVMYFTKTFGCSMGYKPWGAQAHLDDVDSDGVWSNAVKCMEEN